MKFFSLSMLTVWGSKPYAQRMDGYMNACMRKCMHAWIGWKKGGNREPERKNLLIILYLRRTAVPVCFVHQQSDAKLASLGRVIVVFAQMDYWEKTALKVCRGMKNFLRYQEDNGGVRETALPHDHVWGLKWLLWS